MKLSMHWGLALAISAVISGCGKSSITAPEDLRAQELSTTSTVTAPIISNCPTPYLITLESVTQVGGNYEWIWSVTNTNPGNGSNGTVQNLSHWDITLGQCATMADVVSAAYSADGTNWTPFIPTYEDDLSVLNTCSIVTGPVLKFDFGTSGSAKSYYKLVISKNLDVDMAANAFYKSGANTGCGGICYPGLGCPIVEDEGCSFSQGYWFAKPNLVWPGNVTIGGYSYTQAEGVAIWNSSNAGGIGTAKKVFLQVAAIKLSGANVSVSAAVWAQVQIAENWLATLPKLTPTNVKSFNNAAGAAAAKAAADAISVWITENHCE